ncbi:hypothetical protein [Rickettsia endosymbiont of Ixodes scapularis]|uniref:hypothetical protein n=1 Tax=Rickettsia endosymbiont of Ixodes scapularis TaxID=444612 RepID=UPI0001A604C6|nr:hypothetical protein [Rickettsia endosymbiont of Ixodes scapularis]EER20798.1 hypothetical protein REIS_2182 [Rickettsia endosymbiont of Ixodes scapularis]EER20821.1 hypothetical protein REIS_2205 [Rickettsia endosymbiont of Ixodes scapularis]
MKRCFIFCHGFGFDKNFWKNLTPYFLGEQCIYLDLGYFGEKFEPNLETNNVELIGIGHSLGLAKLLTLNKNFDYLIGLNSFINFLGNDQKLHLVRKYELQTLTDHFIASPINTLKNFYKRCGVFERERIANINKQIALNDLEFLYNEFYIPTEIRTLIIGSKNDVIVPPEILFDNFHIYPNINIQMMDMGMHLLGWLEAKSIYQRIMSFLNGTD